MVLSIAIPATLINSFSSISPDGPIQKTEVVEAVLHAKATKGYRLALFSNAPAEYEEAFEQLDWLSEFDFKFVSSQVGAKPDPAAYLEVCRRLRARPEQVTFLDDLEENVLGARFVGMQAIRYEDVSQIERLPNQQNISTKGAL